MCGLEFPDLEYLSRTYRDQGLTVVGLNLGVFGENEASLALFMGQTGVTFDVVWDDGTREWFAWPPSISPLPRQALLGRDGVVRYLAAEHDGGALEAAIVAALDAP